MTDRPNSFPAGLADREDASGANAAAAPPSRSFRSGPAGKPKRKAIPAHVKVSVAIRQANSHAFGGIRCALCDRVLEADAPRVLEHMTQHATLTALGYDPDVVENLRWVHAECADRKTNGTKATTAGSDKHMIAKGKRFDRVNAGLRSRPRKGKPLSHPTLKRTFGGKDNLVVMWQPGEPLATVPIGEFADRCIEYLHDCKDAATVTAWQDTNKATLNEFWARSKSDALAVKAFAERRISELSKRAAAE